MSKLELKKRNIIKQETLEPQCQNKHYSIHSPNLSLEFCNFCKAKVYKTEEGLCSCCTDKIVRPQKFVWVDKALKEGTKQHRSLLRSWTMFPYGLSGSFIVDIRYRDVVYELPIKYLALYNEITDEAREEKLKMIREHMRTVKFRIWYPEDEYTDELCETCKNHLKYNKYDKLFCPICDI